MFLKQHERKMKKNKVFENYAESPFYQISSTAKYLKRMIMNYFSQIGLDMTSDEFLAMDIIYFNPGICQRDLAKELLRDRAGTGRVVSSLETKGIVERSITTKGNHLVRNMKLTPYGEEVLKQSQDKLSSAVENMTKLFPEEETAELNKLLDKLKKILSELVKTNI